MTIVIMTVFLKIMTVAVDYDTTLVMMLVDDEKRFLHDDPFENGIDPYLSIGMRHAKNCDLCWPEFGKIHFRTKPTKQHKCPIRLD